MDLTHEHLPAQSGETRSLVVLLHGFGANGAAMLGLAKVLSPSLPDTAFLAPDAPGQAAGRPGGRAWYTIPELDGSSPPESDRQLRYSAGLLDDFLDRHLTATGLPASSLALLGFSQGAGLAYEVGPRRADQLAGVVAIAGRMKRKDTLVQEVRSRPPYLIITGADDRLLGTNGITTTADALSKAGIHAKRFVMARTGHAISEDGMEAAGAFLKSCLP